MSHPASFHLPPAATPITPLLPGHALQPPRSLTIKFAPLPDPRAIKQRSLSAGENSWVGPDHALDPSACRRPDLNDTPPLSASEPHQPHPDLPFEPDQSSARHSAPCSRPPQTLQRTTSADSVSAVSHTSSCVPPSIASRSDSHSTSLTQKFLGAVSKQRPKPRSLNGSTSNLSSTSSNDYGSPLQHTRSADSSAHSFSSFGSGSTHGMPGCLWKSSAHSLRRTRSKDDDSSGRPRRRAQYPPVAQRKVHMGGSRGGAGRMSIVEEPAFVEWGHSTSAVDSIRSRQQTSHSISTRSSEISSLRSEPVEVDDGSGMAWLKKRRREREERARREAATPQPLPCDPANQTLAPASQPDVILNSLEEEEEEELKSVPSPNETIDGTIQLTQPAASDFSSSGSSSSAHTTVAASSAGIEEEEEEELDEEEDEDEEEVRKEDLLKAKVLAESPFVKGVKEVYTDREHHRMAK